MTRVERTYPYALSAKELDYKQTIHKQDIKNNFVNHKYKNVSQLYYYIFN